MNKDVYMKNIEALEKKYPIWAELVKNVKHKERDFDVIAEESLTGETILKVRQKGKVLYLNGKYAPSAIIEKWINDQGKIEEFATVFIIGISNGIHIKRIMEAVPSTVNILVYEPSFEIFRRAMEEVDLSFLFQPDIPVGIIVDEINGNERGEYMKRFVTFDNLVFMKLFIAGNYMELFRNVVNTFVTDLKEYISSITINWNTVVRYTSIRADNTFHNLAYLSEGYSVEDLKGILPKGVPVIVVAAGPSLNKNVMDLKKAQGKACIIATDTAMKPLLNAGIVPHLFVIVDGLKPADLFKHKDISKSGMVTMTGVSVEPMRLHKGKKFFYYSGTAIENEILAELSRKEARNRTLTDLPTGGSVATSAYSLGVFMGAETIILIGQDLAMTGNRTHADGTFADKMDEIDISSKAYFEVDSIDGGKVLTRGDFKLYLDWYEKQIKLWKNQVTTVDATEGGALIRGTKIMTLKEAIRKYCKTEYNVKWHIDHIPRLFSEENKEIALKYFADAERKLLEVKKKAKEGLNYYEKLSKLAKKPSITETEIQKLLKKIKRINNYMEQDYMAEMVIGSLRGLEYVLRPLIYQTKEEKRSELEDIAEHGKVMLYAAMSAADEISKIAADTVVPYAEKQRSVYNKKCNKIGK